MKVKKRPDSEGLNQSDFIARLQAGDNAAYRELDKELFPYFRTFVYREYGLTKEEANDIVQDVALRIFEKIRFFNPTRGRFEIWHFRFYETVVSIGCETRKNIKRYLLKNYRQILSTKLSNSHRLKTVFHRLSNYHLRCAKPFSGYPTVISNFWGCSYWEYKTVTSWIF